MQAVVQQPQPRTLQAVLRLHVDVNYGTYMLHGTRICSVLPSTSAHLFCWAFNQLKNDSKRGPIGRWSCCLPVCSSANDLSRLAGVSSTG
jgi:hypothetical protein